MFSFSFLFFSFLFFSFPFLCSDREIKEFGISFLVLVSSQNNKRLRAEPLLHSKRKSTCFCTLHQWMMRISSSRSSAAILGEQPSNVHRSTWGWCWSSQDKLRSHNQQQQETTTRTKRWWWQRWRRSLARSALLLSADSNSNNAHDCSPWLDCHDGRRRRRTSFFFLRATFRLTCARSLCVMCFRVYRPRQQQQQQRFPAANNIIAAVVGLCSPGSSASKMEITWNLNK